MNKDLKHRIFDIPQNILDKINHTVIGLNGIHVQGIQRAKRLLTDRKVKYGQLKRIIHDLQNMDIGAERQKYDLAGGDLMKNWAMQFLDGERDLILNKKGIVLFEKNYGVKICCRINYNLKEDRCGSKSQIRISISLINFSTRQW